MIDPRKPPPADNPPVRPLRLLPVGELHARLVEQACRAELRALKPGNVGDHGGTAQLSVRDFELSAQVIGAPLSDRDRPLGERVLAAISATRDAVATNTNLGIVLLLAPLILAAERSWAELEAHGQPPGPHSRQADPRGGLMSLLQKHLHTVLATLTHSDATAVYRAIRLARPGGLGRVDEHDVSDVPTVSLREAMQAAAGRDTIARMYVTDFATLFDSVLPELIHQRAVSAQAGAKPVIAMLDTWPLTRTWLRLLADLPDSLIARKHGMAIAREVSGTAREWYLALSAGDPTPELRDGLLAWDRNLKQSHVNPGTSADMLVAALFVEALLAAQTETLMEKQSMAKIDRVMVGESLVGDGNEVAHIDLLIGPRGSAAETAFCNALVNNKDGFTSLLAVVAPNLPCKPNTVMFNKVTIKGAKQAVQMFGPAQAAVARAVADSVGAGLISEAEADDLFICVGVFVHWLAEDDTKIFDYNYKATKEALERAVRGEPRAATVTAQKGAAKHPFSPK